jgi:hypothetical protein
MTLTRDDIQALKQMPEPPKMSGLWKPLLDAAELNFFNEVNLAAQQKLLDLFECPVHGKGCIPHAIEEVERLRNRRSYPILVSEQLLVLKPVDNEDGEHLTCIICGRGEEESLLAPEWLVTMHSDGVTHVKGLHARCWHKTRRYLEAKGVVTNEACVPTSVTGSESVLLDRIQELEGELRLLADLWRQSVAGGDRRMLDLALKNTTEKWRGA